MVKLHDVGDYYNRLPYAFTALHYKVGQVVCHTTGGALRKVQHPNTGVHNGEHTHTRHKTTHGRPVRVDSLITQSWRNLGRYGNFQHLARVSLLPAGTRHGTQGLCHQSKAHGTVRQRVDGDGDVVL